MCAVFPAVPPCGGFLPRNAALLHSGADLDQAFRRNHPGWARAYRDKYGRWPSGKLADAASETGETWIALDVLLRRGGRGLPGGTSLARLLQTHCGRPMRLKSRPISVEEILQWADDLHARTGKWPTARSGQISGAPPDVRSWSSVNDGLRHGGRGLPDGSSLVLLLERERGRVHRFHRPLLKISTIIKWAKQHRARTGRWPGRKSGPVADAPQETWGQSHRP